MLNLNPWRCPKYCQIHKVSSPTLLDGTPSPSLWQRNICPSNSYWSQACLTPASAPSSLPRSGKSPKTRRCVGVSSTKRTRQELADGSRHLDDPTRSQPQWISSRYWGQLGWQTIPRNWPTDDVVPSVATSILLRTWCRTCWRLWSFSSSTSQTSQGDELGCGQKFSNSPVKY